MNYEKMAQEIIKNVGSATNIKDGTHCFTRLRLAINDKKKVDLEELKKIDGVIDARFQSGQLQVIIGNNVGKVFEKISPYLTNSDEPVKEKQRILDTVFTTIAAIFTPILPAIIGAGLMKGILPLLVMLKLIVEGSDTYQILTIVADTSFNFLPVLIAVSASRRFKVNEFLGVTLACSLLYPTILNGEGTLYLFNIIPIPVMSYTSTVIPIILGVWVMSYVYRAVDKIVPSVVKMIFTPLLVLLIMIPLTLAVFGPIGFYIGKGLAVVSLWLAETVPFLYGIVIGGFYPLIIMTGMHYAFFPMMLENVSRLGYENGFLPISLFANIAMAAATLAIAFKVKNKEMKEISYSSAVSAFFGITEPALYGVILKYKKALYAVMIAGGITSSIMITLGVKMFSFLTPGILSLPVFVNPDGTSNNFILALIGIAISGLLAFFITLLAKIEFNPNSTKEQVEASNQAKTEKNIPAILAPVSGTIKNLEECSDSVFSEGLLGKGIVILPEEDQLFAPFDGVVSALMPEKHAIGLTSKDGVELLIHIGIDTVAMGGKGFKTLVSIGDTVTSGQKLVMFDRQLIASLGYSIEIPIIVTNTANYFEIVPMTTNEQVVAGDELITIVN